MRLLSILLVLLLSNFAIAHVEQRCGADSTDSHAAAALCDGEADPFPFDASFDAETGGWLQNWEHSAVCKCAALIVVRCMFTVLRSVPLSVCNIDRVREDELTQAEFERKYLNKRPVILYGSSRNKVCRAVLVFLLVPTE